MKTRLTCRGSRLRLAMLQYRDHFFVLNLSKVGEELPHSVKLAWHLQTERSVTFPVYRLRGIGRSHCHRRDELLRCGGTDCPQRRDHCRARSDAIINHDDNASLKIDRGTQGGVPGPALAQSSKLPLFF
jgi:hypothetical protein